MFSFNVKVLLVTSIAITSIQTLGIGNPIDEDDLDSDFELLEIVNLNNMQVTPHHQSFSWRRVRPGKNFITPCINGAEVLNNTIKTLRNVDSFPSPDTVPWGLAWGDNRIWHSDLRAQRIYKIDPSSGSVISQFAAPDNWTKDLAFDGSYLWACGNFYSSIYKMDTLTGAVVYSFYSPEVNPLGLTYDGAYLWHTSHPGTDALPTQVYQIDPANGQIISSFPLPFQWANGLAWDNGFLLISDSDCGIIYKVDPSTGVILDAFGSPGNSPLGLAYDSNAIWNVDRYKDNIYWFEPDSAPPAVVMNQPIADKTYPTWQSVVIFGTVMASDLVSWSVEYAQGENPVVWNTIDSLHYSSVVYDTLAIWDVSSLVQDFYWLRIRVDLGGSVIDTSSVVSIYIDPEIMNGWPKEYPNISPVAVSSMGDGGTMKLSAGVEHNHGMNCKVIVWDLYGQELWQSPNSVNNSHTPVAIGNVDDQGLLEIATGYPAWAYSDDSVAICLVTYQGGMYPNWPQNGQKINGFWASVIPTFADMDGDDDLEIFAGGKHLFGWHHTGLPYAGCPTGYIVSEPAIGDINGDTLNDLVFKNGNSLEALDKDGNPLTGFPISLPSSGLYTFPVLGDVNNNGRAEVVFALDNMGIYVVDSIGSVLSGWPQYVSGAYTNSPILGDIDDNGDLEIVVISGVFPSYSIINVFEHDGSLYPGWPQQLNGAVFRTFNGPVIAHVGGDTLPDIIMGFESISGYEEIYAWDRNADVLPNWPKRLSDIYGYGITGAPTIGDFDSDGYVNLAISSNAYWIANTEVYVWGLPCEYIEDAMEWPTYRHNVHRTANYHFDKQVSITENRSQNLTSTGIDMVVSPSVSSRFLKIKTFIPPQYLDEACRLAIYDINGRMVQSFTDLESGSQTIALDLSVHNRDYAQGVYFVVLYVPPLVMKDKIVLVRP